jgi:hypothetical protein
MDYVLLMTLCAGLGGFCRRRSTASVRSLLSDQDMTAAEIGSAASEGVRGDSISSPAWECERERVAYK